MEKKENKIIKCHFITPTEWEQINNSEKNYFDNCVKIITDGYLTYCCSETIIRSIVEHLNDETLTFSNKTMKNEGKIIEYVFIDNQNYITIKIDIPTRLKQDKYTFIENDIIQLDKLCNATNKLRNPRIRRNIGKSTFTALLSAATLALSYTGTKKIIKELNKPAPPREHQTYNLYYGNIMKEEDFNANVERLQEIVEKQKQKQLKK